MRTDDLDQSLVTLFSELVYGAPPDGAYVLNRGDEGLLAALDRLSAEDASASREGGGSIAAHVDHVRYGFSLLNRWAAGEEDAWAEADWSATWNRRRVTEPEWDDLRRRFREETDHWYEALQSPRKVEGVELNGVIGSVVHLAYHLGAIRQIEPRLRGPKAND